MKLILLLVLVNQLYSMQLSCSEPEVIATGFSWAENLVVDDDLTVYVSDVNTGKLHRIQQQNNEVILEGFKSCLGLALDKPYLYMVVQTSDKQNQVLQIDLENGYKITRVYTLPDYFFFNGLALNKKTMKLYVSNEGYFLNGKALIYEIDLENEQNSQIFADGLTSADGLYIDQQKQILYASQVFCLTEHSSVLMYNLTSRQLISKQSLKGYITQLDDFTVDDSYIIGADFWEGNVVRLNFEESQIIAQGLNYPSSVRNKDKVYFVTESGFYKSYLRNEQRVLKISCQ